MDGSWKVPDSAPSLFVAGETPLLHVESQVFEAMLVGSTWRPVDVEEVISELRYDGRALATVRAYQGALRQFRDYVPDPRYQYGRPRPTAARPLRSVRTLTTCGPGSPGPDRTTPGRGPGGRRRAPVAGPAVRR